ncbi:uncharacterized protein LAESUDRAFT_762553 [Laetiporus sulphureus 93-53]|uniref:Cupin 2 conserved barrel domain-containing protein n=1 Tax=Laetiporus sulphureus 93-53 TaxID=1314785 RepID=A0A165CE98_9APHY|nr:uncharacterized protein LAESUDRAFT_762553 [Laetiporus sulphureus 93-53]KZT02656.1 hypothetical protein LAESUDRAFT_762553 [Laetiporus sulphureus 93-53]
MSAELPPPLRIVTGHTDIGWSSIRSEDRVEPKKTAGFLGVQGAPLWVTDSVPTNDNNNDVDGATRQTEGDFGLVMRNGTVLRYTDIAPGAMAFMHRSSSFDYNVLIRGKLILEMEDGTERTLETPGDIVIQRGTLHAWRNPGPEWTRFVSVLVDAKPALVNGEPLEPDIYCQT